MTISVQRLSHLDPLDAKLLRAWDIWPKSSPMQSHAWLSTWFDMMPDQTLAEPCLVVVRRDDEPIGLAPWYVGMNALGMRTLRFLGDGHVGSDHASLLIKPGEEPAVVDALANWLRRGDGRLWDVIHFESIDAGPSPLRDLWTNYGEGAGCSLERSAQACWTIELPDTVEQYFAELSKNHRKRCRRWWKDYFTTGRAKAFIYRRENLITGWNELERLNRARRENVGDRSAFLDRGFTRFHREVLPLLAEEGSVELQGLTIDGRPAAVEYLLKQAKTLFCYQSGMDPNAGDDVGPGNLSLLAMFCRAIEEGYRRVDFLRGDEAYKQHWNAVRRPCTDLYAASGSLAGRADALRRRAMDWARSLRSRAPRAGLSLAAVS